MTASSGDALGLAAPVLIYLGLGDTSRELLSVSPMEMDVSDDLILADFSAGTGFRVTTYAISMWTAGSASGPDQ